jgi:hypothetical protein
MFKALKPKLAKTKDILCHHNSLNFNYDVYLCYNIALHFLILEINRAIILFSLIRHFEIESCKKNNPNKQEIAGLGVL